MQAIKIRRGQRTRSSLLSKCSDGSWIKLMWKKVKIYFEIICALTEVSII